MELRSRDGQSLRLDIVGYQFPDIAAEESDANWLRIELAGSTTRGRWRSVDPSLLTYEVAALADWFDRVANGSVQERPLEFIEPNLSFRLSPDATFRVYLELESRPPWAASKGAPEEDLWLEFPLDSGMLREAARDLRAQLARYPERPAP
jgi:hypothetical protein